MRRGRRISPIVPHRGRQRPASTTAQGLSRSQSGVVQSSRPSAARPSANGVNPSTPAEAAARHAGRDPANQHRPAGVPDLDLDVRGDDAREVRAVLVVQVFAFLGHGPDR